MITFQRILQICLLPLIFITFINMAALNAANVNAELTGGLSGLIMDESSQQPVEFATIGIYNAEDSTLITGTITDENGNFELERVPHGKYYLDVQFLGYAGARIDDIQLKPGSNRINLGSIFLQQSAKRIDEVEIVAQQAAVEYKLDKKVINVSSQLSAAGGSAIDVLESAPSIRTDVNGDILLRGSSSFTVLIDGKPSPLSGSDALRQMPAASIQSVEIMTNPSAKYEPDGTAGIINIVTRKNRQMGINGLASASYFTSGKYNANLNLNRRYGKLNLRGGAWASSNPTPWDWQRTRISGRNDTLRIASNEGWWHWGFRGQGVNLGGDFTPNPRHYLSFTASAMNGRFGFDNAADYWEITDPVSEERFYTQDNVFDVTWKNMAYNFYWQHHMDTLGQLFKINANYQRAINLDGNESYTQLKDASWNPIGDPPARQRTVTEAVSDQLQLKLDYEKPLLKSSKLEAGYQGNFNHSPEQYRWEEFDPDLGDWQADPVVRSDNVFKRNIQAVYLIYSHQHKILDFQGGLRAEHLDREIYAGIIDERYRYRRIDFYPSLSMSKGFGKGHQLQASYSRRVQRPPSWKLWPMEMLMDPTTIYTGNPELEPEFTNSYELNYMKKFGGNFFTLETYYRNTLNAVDWVYNQREDGLTDQTHANLNKSDAWGSEFLLNIEITRWWTFVGSVDFFRRQVDSRNLGVVQRTGNSFSSKIDNSLKLPWGSLLQVSSRLYGKSLTAQGYRDPYWTTNVGLKQAFLKRKLTLTFTVRDVFSTQNITDYVESAAYTQIEKSFLQGPIFGLSLSYAINNYKQRGGDSINMDFSEGGF